MVHIRPKGHQVEERWFWGAEPGLLGGTSQRGRLQLRLGLHSVPSDEREEWVFSRISRLLKAGRQRLNNSALQWNTGTRCLLQFLHPMQLDVSTRSKNQAREYLLFCLEIQRPVFPGVAGNPEGITALEDTKSLTSTVFQSPHDCRVVRDLRHICKDEDCQAFQFLLKVIKPRWLLTGGCYKTSAKYNLANQCL